MRIDHRHLWRAAPSNVVRLARFLGLKVGPGCELDIARMTRLIEAIARRCG